jgi:hypothetical protein
MQPWHRPPRMVDGLFFKHFMTIRILIPYAGPLRNAPAAFAAKVSREAHTAWTECNGVNIGPYHF